MVTKFSKFSKKRKAVFENVVAGVVFVVLVGGIIGLFVFQNVKLGEKRSELEGRLQELQAQAEALSAQKIELEKKIAESQTEEYQEKLLREQGLYQRPGEEVVTVLPPEGTVEETPKAKENGRTWWNPFTW